jgi:hypothetical protein
MKTSTPTTNQEATMKKNTTPKHHLTITEPEGHEVVRLEVTFPEGMHYRIASAFLHRLAAELELSSAESSPTIPSWVIQTTGIGLLGRGKGSMGSVEVELGTANERNVAIMYLTMLKNNYNNGHIAGL